ncbi:MAG: hypothetical protein WA628_08120 [Terriglobales bacterium]
MINDIVALASLAVAVVTLSYLITYVKATKMIAEQSVLQTEAQSRPAVVVKPATSAGPILVNIGNGPAMELKWSIPGTTRGNVIHYLEPRQIEHLDTALTSELRSLGKSARMQNQAADELLYPRIICTYRSLSGMQYTSANRYDVDYSTFSTTFEPNVKRG